MSRPDPKEWLWPIEAQPMRPLPQPCYCVGPQNGDPVCPCAMRTREAYKSNDWLDGFEAGKRYADAKREG